MRDLGDGIEMRKSPKISVQVSHQGAEKLQNGADLLAKTDGILRENDFCNALRSRDHLDYFGLLCQIHGLT